MMPNTPAAVSEVKTEIKKRSLLWYLAKLWVWHKDKIEDYEFAVFFFGMAGTLVTAVFYAHYYDIQKVPYSNMLAVGIILKSLIAFLPSGLYLPIVVVSIFTNLSKFIKSIDKKLSDIAKE